MWIYLENLLRLYTHTHTHSLQLHCMVTCKHYSHLLLFIIVLKSLLNGSVSFFFSIFFLAGSFPRICTDDSLPSSLQRLSPFPSDKSKWNGSFHSSYRGQAMKYAWLCQRKRWRRRTFDLQNPADNYLFTYLSIYCWHWASSLSPFLG